MKGNNCLSVLQSLTCYFSLKKVLLIVNSSCGKWPCKWFFTVDLKENLAYCLWKFGKKENINAWRRVHDLIWQQAAASETEEGRNSLCWLWSADDWSICSWDSNLSCYMSPFSNHLNFCDSVSFPAFLFR